MLDRLADWILSIFNSVPILLGADPHNAVLVRAVVALLFVVLVVYLLATLPFRTVLDYFASLVRRRRGPNV